MGTRCSADLGKKQNVVVISKNMVFWIRTSRRWLRGLHDSHDYTGKCLAFYFRIFSPFRRPHSPPPLIRSLSTNICAQPPAKQGRRTFFLSFYNFSPFVYMHVSNPWGRGLTPNPRLPLTHFFFPSARWHPVCGCAVVTLSQPAFFFSFP